MALYYEMAEKRWPAMKLSLEKKNLQKKCTINKTYRN
ncbi:hypothetical protein A2U01_0079022, partial [Trifolium medium]|nr:hypothetical protein [Trifolium medium]